MTQTPNHFIYISPSEMERFISDPLAVLLDDVRALIHQMDARERFNAAHAIGEERLRAIHAMLTEAGLIATEEEA